VLLVVGAVSLTPPVHTTKERKDKSINQSINKRIHTTKINGHPDTLVPWQLLKHVC
jgi:hypothetical protein